MFDTIFIPRLYYISVKISYISSFYLNTSIKSIVENVTYRIKFDYRFFKKIGKYYYVLYGILNFLNQFFIKNLKILSFVKHRLMN